MANALVKVGPLGGFVAAVGYCVWPYIGAEPPPAAPPPRLPVIEAGWLEPAFGPPADRDPFLPAGATPADSRPAVAGGPKAGAAGASIAARGAGTRPSRPEPVPDFSLGATLVASRRPAAIINGRVYRQGDAIEVPGPDAGPWTLERVEAGRVLIARPKRGDPVVLEFRDPLVATAGGRGLATGRLAKRLDLRSALAAVGVPLLDRGLLERLAGQPEGTSPAALREMLNLLIASPRSAMPRGDGDEDGAGGRPL